MAMRTNIAGPALLLMAGMGFDGGALATSAAAEGQAPVPAATTFKRDALRAYAGALVELQALQRQVAAQSASLTVAQRTALAGQAAAQMALVLQRHELDPATFNAISKAVEANPDIRLKVRQAMMDEVMGT